MPEPITTTPVFTDLYFRRRLQWYIPQSTGSQAHYEAGRRLLLKWIDSGQILSDLYWHYIAELKKYVGVN